VRALLTGATGQLGSALRRTAPLGVEVFAFDQSELDIRNATLVGEAVRRTRPQLLINAAAYTAVDRAEAEPSLALEVNAGAPRALADAAASVDARMIQVSTDFVFAGDRAVPYDVGAETGPLSVYGQSKLAGEQAVIGVLGTAATVMRTSWLYGSPGNNFVLTMIRLLQDRGSVDVVYDQVGCPTWVESLASAIWALARRPEVNGIQHWSDHGVASWYDFAVAIQEEAIERGLLDRQVPIRAIRTSQYPTPARRPAYSVLDKGHTVAALGLEPAHWRTNLRLMLDELTRA
jgi:dTDP-4-dehydrorhamnose reductase